MIMATSIYQKNFIDKRRKNHLCVDCGKPLDREGYRCIECNNIANEKHRNDKKWYSSNKICPKCKENELLGEEKVCPECSARAYAITMRSRERLGKEHYNKIHREWARKEYHNRIEQGICTRCGKRKADSGYKTCGVCRKKVEKTRKAREPESPIRSERYKQGLCYFCDNPIKPRYKVCEKHYQMNLQKLDNDKCRKATEDIKKDMKKYFI